MDPILASRHLDAVQNEGPTFMKPTPTSAYTEGLGSVPGARFPFPGSAISRKQVFSNFTFDDDPQLVESIPWNSMVFQPSRGSSRPGETVIRSLRIPPRPAVTVPTVFRSPPMVGNPPSLSTGRRWTPSASDTTAHGRGSGPSMPLRDGEPIRAAGVARRWPPGGPCAAARRKGPEVRISKGKGGRWKVLASLALLPFWGVSSGLAPHATAGGGAGSDNRPALVFRVEGSGSDPDFRRACEVVKALQHLYGSERYGLHQVVLVVPLL